MLKKIFVVALFQIALTFSALAQDTKTLVSPKPTPDPPPGNIQLLENYLHIKAEAIDTEQGEISKPEGMKIYYQNGDVAGDHADNWCGKGECVWYKVQKINGCEVRLGLTKEGKVVARFPKDFANFYAQTKSQEDIADFLIMILTYKIKEN